VEPTAAWAARVEIGGLVVVEEAFFIRPLVGDAVRR
jgi:hypothetical protein